ncbi:hypothetical protein PM082_012423 [Marasmius tenuissimus]|nr:hypothetical protein PM082_012423 [Marasmius tenuissimus]
MSSKNMSNARRAKTVAPGEQPSKQPAAPKEASSERKLQPPQPSKGIVAETNTNIDPPKRKQSGEASSATKHMKVDPPGPTDSTPGTSTSGLTGLTNFGSRRKAQTDAPSISGTELSMANPTTSTMVPTVALSWTPATAQVQAPSVHMPAPIFVVVPSRTSVPLPAFVPPRELPLSRTHNPLPSLPPLRKLFLAQSSHEES